jgi:ABC-type lipoprotein release transport system permease subunit
LLAWTADEMSALLVIFRIATADIRRRRTQAALIMLAIMTASAVLTLALALHGVASQPYQQTRQATAGPDVVAQLGPAPGSVDGQPLAAERALASGPEVLRASGPFPVTGAVLRAHGNAAAAEAEGRGTGPAAVDQPKLTLGSWVRSGQVVIERTFAGSLGVGVGDSITVNGRAFTVAGLAVTAAVPPYPNVCYVGCRLDGPPANLPGNNSPGLIWLTDADARSVAAVAGEQLTYVVNLRLRDPARAPAFVSAYNSGPGSSTAFLIPWQTIRSADGLLVADEQQVLLVGSWLASLLAVASVAVLAGGRMAEQTRRVGLLKAVGSTPGLIAAVLLAENLILALAAAAAGLVAGRLAAPLLTSPGAGLVGAPGAPGITISTIGLVVAVAFAVAVASTLIPAIRAARISTVSALADSVRPPRRRAVLNAISARLPVPLLLGLRLVGRKPRRMLLSAASVAVTATGLVATLAFHATADERLYGGSSGLTNPVASRDEQGLLILTIVLIALAAVNAIFTAWATVQDTRRASALARALGAGPQQVTAGIAAAQVLSALPGAIVGVPLGIGLFAAANGAGVLTIPPVWWLLTVVLVMLLVVGGLTAVPARVGCRRPPGDMLRTEA